MVSYIHKDLLQKGILQSKDVYAVFYWRKRCYGDFNFIGKHLCWSLFLIKLQSLGWYFFMLQVVRNLICSQLAIKKQEGQKSYRISRFDLTFQKLFVIFPNKNNGKTNIKCWPPRLGKEKDV